MRIKLCVYISCLLKVTRPVIYIINKAGLESRLTVETNSRLSVWWLVDICSGSLYSAGLSR